MNTITITAPIPPRATYQRHVLEAGHCPGVLSGAELKGKARTYGAGYYHARLRVMRLASEHGVTSDLVLIGSRWSRVWTHDGAPVRLELAA